MAHSDGFEGLKRVVEERARRDLRERQPEYVMAFQRELQTTGSDLKNATEVARTQLTDDLEPWPGVLTALFDMEYVRLKLTTCHTLLLRYRDLSDADAGFWFSYHLDHWIFEADAFVERCKKAMAKCVRALVRPVEPEHWQAFERELIADLGTIKAELAKVRGKWAHGGGGGVDGLAQEWLPMLAAPVPVFADPEFVRGSASSLHTDIDIGRRQRWFDAVHRSSVIIFAYSEAFSDKVLQKIASPRS